MEFQIIFYSEKFLHFCAYVYVYVQEEYWNFLWPNSTDTHLLLISCTRLNEFQNFFWGPTYIQAVEITHFDIDSVTIFWQKSWGSRKERSSPWTRAVVKRLTDR